MPDVTLTDTKEKMIMQDHDILIALSTQMADLIRRYDDSNQIAREQNANFVAEMKVVSVETVRMASDLKALKEDFQEHKESDAAWKARWEQKSNVWDVINSLGILVSAAIGYFLGK